MFKTFRFSFAEKSKQPPKTPSKSAPELSSVSNIKQEKESSQQPTENTSHVDNQSNNTKIDSTKTETETTFSYSQNPSSLGSSSSSSSSPLDEGTVESYAQQRIHLQNQLKRLNLQVQSLDTELQEYSRLLILQQEKLELEESLKKIYTEIQQLEKERETYLPSLSRQTTPQTSRYNTRPHTVHLDSPVGPLKHPINAKPSSPTSPKPYIPKFSPVPPLPSQILSQSLSPRRIREGELNNSGSTVSASPSPSGATLSFSTSNRKIQDLFTDKREKLEEKRKEMQKEGDKIEIERLKMIAGSPHFLQDFQSNNNERALNLVLFKIFHSKEKESDDEWILSELEKLDNEELQKTQEREALKLKNRKKTRKERERERDRRCLRQLYRRVREQIPLIPKTQQINLTKSYIDTKRAHLILFLLQKYYYFSEDFEQPINNSLEGSLSQTPSLGDFEEENDSNSQQPKQLLNAQQVSMGGSSSPTFSSFTGFVPSPSPSNSPFQSNTKKSHETHENNTLRHLILDQTELDDDTLHVFCEFLRQEAISNKENQKQQQNHQTHVIGNLPSSSKNQPHPDQLKGLSLCGNLITERGGKDLGHLLLVHPSLCYLSLNCNQLKGSIRYFSHVLKRNILKSLSVCNNQITDEEIKWLGHCILTNNSLEILLLGDNPSIQGEIQYLAEGIRVHNTLSVLSLYNTQLSDSSAIWLSESLRTNIVLSSLSLSHNYISDQGSRWLSDSLKINNSLSFLDLSHNSLYDLGVMLLSESLRFNTSIQVLSLSGNHYTSDSFLSLSHFLRYLKDDSQLSELILFQPSSVPVLQQKGEHPKESVEQTYRDPSHIKDALSVDSPLEVVVSRWFPVSPFNSLHSISHIPISSHS